MILNFIIISFTSYNFGIKKFNSFNGSFNLPHIIIPYYPYQNETISLANKFLNESSSNESYVAASINCDQYTTVCSLLELNPGFIFASFPPHRYLQASNRKINLKNIRQLASDVSVNGLYRDITTIQQLQEIANECPLFCLFARSNAGDLEVKLPVVEQIAKIFVQRNVRFAFITEFSLYEKFARHPLTSFVYVSPSLKHSTQRGDFTLENLLDFVKKYEQPVWQELIDTPPSHVALTIVGKNLNDTKRTKKTDPFESLINIDEDDIDEDEDIDFDQNQKNTINDNIDDNDNSTFVDKFKRYQAQYPMVFVDNEKESSRAFSICHESMRCIAVVDFKKFRSIIIPEDATETEILKTLRDFNSIWKQKKLTERIAIVARNLVFLNFQIFCTCGSAVLFLLGLIGLFFIDKKREIPDERKGVLTKTKTK